MIIYYMIFSSFQSAYMRKAKPYFLLAVVAVAVCPFMAKADPPKQPGASTHGSPDTRIEADDDADVIQFIVAGREVARLTSEGLIVRDDLRFGGMMKDIGDGNYDAELARATKETK